jgi:hypothetical protein
VRPPSPWSQSVPVVCRHPSPASGVEMFLCSVSRFPRRGFPPAPCSRTPPRVPCAIDYMEVYWCLPSCRPSRPPDVVTRLDRFTCVTAQISLCLYITQPPHPRAKASITGGGGSFPLPGGVSPAGRSAWHGAPKITLNVMKR